ncbi:MAG: hypothetical protein PHE54_01360 [Bacilli bacterium]|nr:hypothetical protein [Bacilli bacterium]
MRKYNEILNRYNLKPHRYQLIGKATLIDTDDGCFVIKEKNRNDDKEIIRYLESRSFDYYPKILSDTYDDYELTEYIEQANMPDEQKLLDMMDLVGLLHSKTTYYKEVDEAEYKKIYEDVSNNIEYLLGYYNDMAAIVESKVFMSPSEYLFIRNLSKLFSSLFFCKQELEKWYEMVKVKNKQRQVVLHNNLDISHFIRNNSSYLISWDKSKMGIPIFDLYKLYRRTANEYDFSEVFKRYERNYPLLEDEKKLFFILVALPDKIDFSGSEYEKCLVISKKINMIFKTELFVTPYYQ